MAFYRNLRMTSKIVLPVGIMLILALGGLTWAIQSKSSEIIQNIAERELAALAGQYGNEAKSFFENSLNETQAIADAELAKTLKKIGPVDAQTVKALEAMLKAVVKKINHEPITFIKRVQQKHGNIARYIDILRSFFSLDKRD